LNIPAHIIVFAIIIIALTAMLVISVQSTVPMFVRTQFDDICNRGLALIERDGGLNQLEKDKIRTELNEMGITNVIISAPVNSTWGSEVTLRVEGDYTYDITNYPELSKSTQTKQLVYENSTLVLNLGG